jgi:hypothetical protein
MDKSQVSSAIVKMLIMAEFPFNRLNVVVEGQQEGEVSSFTLDIITTDDCGVLSRIRIAGDRSQDGWRITIRRTLVGCKTIEREVVFDHLTVNILRNLIVGDRSEEE